MKKYIAYYRVSTKQQGISGLGLDSQKEIVKRFCHDGVIVAEFQDIESGKNDSRPGLNEALKRVQIVDGILVIAKLDRLSRNLTFISQLRDSQIEFVCCDMPNANKMTIGIMAVVAQEEREMISKRTKDALQVLRDRGVKLGNPSSLKTLDENGNVKAIANRIKNVKKRYEEKNKIAIEIAKDWEERGKTLQEIANQLNKMEIKTSNGCEFKTEQVRRLLGRKSKVSPKPDYFNVGFKGNENDGGSFTAPDGKTVWL